MQQTAYMVFNKIMFENVASLFSGMTVDRSSY